VKIQRGISQSVQTVNTPRTILFSPAVLIFMVILLIIIGCLMIYFGWNFKGGEPEDSRIWPDILRNLGEAILIAGILAGTVEIYLRNRRREEEAFFAQQANQNVFWAVLRQNVPDAILKEVQAHLLTNPFLRKNYQVITSMEWADKDKGSLKSTVTQDYEIHKLAARECTFNLVSNIDIEPGFGASFTSLQVRTIAGQPIENYGLEEIKNITRKDEEAKLVWLQKDIDLRQHDKLRITCTAEVFYRPDDFMIWMTTNMTEEFTVRYSAPSDLQFTFIPNHPSGALFHQFDDGGIRECGFKGGFLPFQGITVQWRRKG